LNITGVTGCGLNTGSATGRSAEREARMLLHVEQARARAAHERADGLLRIDVEAHGQDVHAVPDESRHAERRLAGGGEREHHASPQRRLTVAAATRIARRR
jgi:hypothetical protein